MLSKSEKPSNSIVSALLIVKIHLLKQQGVQITRNKNRKINGSKGIHVGIKNFARASNQEVFYHQEMTLSLPKISFSS
jgi:hypothetical protein